MKEDLPQDLLSQLQGNIYTYKKSRNYGFLRGTDGQNYFFHRSAVIDEDLLIQIENLDEKTLGSNEQIAATFEATHGPQGLVAVNVSLHQMADQAFERAITYANNGDYIKAVTQ